LKDETDARVDAVDRLAMMRTSPTVGFSKPVIRLSVVDLPQPVGPTTAQNSPRATLNGKIAQRHSSLAIAGNEAARNIVELNRRRIGRSRTVDGPECGGRSLVHGMFSRRGIAATDSGGNPVCLI